MITAGLVLIAVLAMPVAADYPVFPPDQTSYGGPFTLIDHHGTKVTEQDFLGDYLLLYFG